MKTRSLQNPVTHSLSRFPGRRWLAAMMFFAAAMLQPGTLHAQGQAALAAALGSTGLNWTASGWSVVGSGGHSGATYASGFRSGFGPGGPGAPSATLSTSVTGPGELRFWWRADLSVSPGGFIGFPAPGDVYFGIDGFGSILTGGSADAWTEKIVAVPAGTYTLIWKATPGAHIFTCYPPTGMYCPGPEIYAGDTPRFDLDDVTWTPSTATGFATWATAAGLSGADATAEADPDRDGQSNLLEYALGTLPRTPGASPVAALAAPSGGLTIRFRPSPDATGLRLTAESAGTLAGPWTTAAERSAAGVWTAAAGFTVSTEAGTGVVSVTGQPGGQARLFLRMKVAQL